MNDPLRLSDIDGGGYEASLIRAGRGEAPRAAVRRASALALGLASAAPVAQAAATGLTGSAVALAGVKGLVAGAVFSVMATGVSRLREPTRDVRTKAPTALEPTARGVAGTATSAPAFVAATSAEPPAPEPAGERPGQPEASPAARRTLSDEMAAFGLAQRALEHGDPSGALAALARFDQEFPAATLAQEAEVLRIEALAARGERASAVTRGRAFLAAHPNAPAARRIGSLLSRLEGEGQGDQNTRAFPLNAPEDP